jgi:hypothetical protein
MAGAASAATPAMTASPNWGLADGQTIHVAGTGYPVNVTVEVFQCDAVLGCDFNTSWYFRSSANGNCSGSYTVSRIVHPNGKTVDCAHTGHCILVGVNYPNPTAIAKAAVHFDPNIPVLPPFAISMSLDGNDGVIVSSGQVVLHGNITCNRPADDMYVEANVQQVNNGTVARSYGDSEGSCKQAGTFPWELTVNPDTQYFTTGTASVYMYASGSSGRSYARTSTNGTVVLSAVTLPILKPSGANVTVPAVGSTVVLHYWVVLSAPSQFPVSFQYSTLNGSASAPQDYVTTSGSATIPAGDTKAIVPITINGTNESAGNRTFIVSISNPSNASLGADHGRGVVTLHHN